MNPVYVNGQFAWYCLSKAKHSRKWQVLHDLQKAFPQDILATFPVTVDKILDNLSKIIILPHINNMICKLVSFSLICIWITESLAMPHSGYPLKAFVASDNFHSPFSSLTSGWAGGMLDRYVCHVLLVHNETHHGSINTSAESRARMEVLLLSDMDMICANCDEIACSSFRSLTTIYADASSCVMYAGLLAMNLK